MAKRTCQQISAEANADIPNPPDADAWFDRSDDGSGPKRLFIGSTWVVPVIGRPPCIRGNESDIRIEIRGRQHEDGRCERWVALGTAPYELPRRHSAVVGGVAGSSPDRDRTATAGHNTFPSFSETDR